MILDNRQSGSIVSSGVLDSKKFTIQADGKVFKMVSDTLYQNKPESIVRELSCNALDSHTMAGFPEKPFEIHVPSIYEPYFGVKDFGLGLSHEDMYEVYTVLFKSTKDNSNEAIGGFGLGSKTPFSYTDSFTVVSIFNGMKRHYTVMKDETGVPALSLFFEEETNEHNGLEVQVNVKTDDCARFRNAIVTQLKHFKVKPTLVNAPAGFEIGEIEFVADYGRFKVPSNFHGLYIVQGQVGYPLELEQFSSKIKDQDNMRFFEVYNNGILYFDIGEIEVTVSREGISYSEHTIASIEKAISEVSPTVFKETIDKIAAFSNDWERLAYVNTDAYARGMTKLANISFGKTGTIGDKTVAIYGRTGSTQYINLTSERIDPVSKKHNFFVSRVGNNGTREYISNDILIEPNSRVRVFVRDKCKAAIGRIKDYAKENSHLTVFLFEHPESSDKADDAFVNYIKSLLGGCNVDLVGSLPELPKSQSVLRGSPLVYFFDLGKRSIKLESIYHWSRCYEEEEIENGYYIEFDTFPRLDLNSDETNLIQMIYDNNLFDKPIYAVKASRAAILKNNPNFMPAIDKAKEIVDDYEKDMFKNKTEMERYNAARKLNEFLNENNGDLMLGSFKSEDLNRLPKKFVTNRASKVKKIVDRYIEKIEKKYKIDSNAVVRNLFYSGATKTTTNTAKVENLIKGLDPSIFKEKYPMIKAARSSGYYYSNNRLHSKEFADYVLLIDSLS